MGTEFAEMGASKYIFVQEVGKGSFGCVVLAKNSDTGELVAIKKMVRVSVGGYGENCHRERAPGARRQCNPRYADARSRPGPLRAHCAVRRQARRHPARRRATLKPRPPPNPRSASTCRDATSSLRS
jgi:hypothetical protein